MAVYLAKDTSTALGAGLVNCQSVSLLLSKFPILSSWSQSKRASLGLAIRDGDSGWVQEDGRRDKEPSKPIQRLRDFALNGAASQRKLDTEFTSTYLRSQLRYRLSLPGAAHHVGALAASMALDLATGCLENAGLCLHPFSSLPIIPGSAVKGCARAAAIAQLRQATEDRSPAREQILRSILEVFGWAKDDVEKKDSDLFWAWDGPIPAPTAKANSGRVSFLPGFPVALPPLQIDVLACHHPKYYTTNRKDAADDEQPNIQVFPVVASGAKFLFTIVPLPGASEAILKSALQFLAEGLQVWGIGAKTAAGYGYFRLDDGELEKLRADFSRPSAPSHPGELVPTAAPPSRKTYRESLEQGEKDVMQEFANRHKLEPDQQRELLEFIRAKGVENALNPKGNPKGSRRVQEFHDWQASFGEGSES
ncbi:MAG: hypothetical protein Kow001_05410 [Acidobacteriota bacterium]